jgi:lipid-A-disaccharide synthase-like uncharacterized protein
MNIIFIIYLLATTASIAAGAPQLKRLVATKRSDEFSLVTWVIWLLAQVVQLIYALSVSDRLYAIVCILWLTFYIFIVSLIIKYRHTAPAIMTDAAS